MNFSFSRNRINFGAAFMKPSVDADTLDSLFGVAPPPTFASNPNASTTSASSFGAPARSHAFLAPTSLRSSDTPSPFATLASTTHEIQFTPSVKELSGEAIDHAIGADPSALLKDIEVLRLYSEIDEIPFAFIDEIYTQVENAGAFREMHVCVQLSLRSALQNIYNNIGFKRALRSAMRKWVASKIVLKFYFPPAYVTSAEL